MYTRQQAQSLWCPLRGGFNAAVPPALPDLPTCLADACSLWRWRAVQTCDPNQNCIEYCHSCPARRGYCGYGGSPETV